MQKLHKLNYLLCPCCSPLQDSAADGQEQNLDKPKDFDTHKEEGKDLKRSSGKKSKRSKKGSARATKLAKSKAHREKRERREISRRLELEQLREELIALTENLFGLSIEKDKTESSLSLEQPLTEEIEDQEMRVEVTQEDMEKPQELIQKSEGEKVEERQHVLLNEIEYITEKAKINEHTVEQNKETRSEKKKSSLQRQRKVSESKSTGSETEGEELRTKKGSREHVVDREKDMEVKELNAQPNSPGKKKERRKRRDSKLDKKEKDKGINLPDEILDAIARKEGRELAKISSDTREEKQTKSDKEKDSPKKEANMEKGAEVAKEREEKEDLRKNRASKRKDLLEGMLKLRLKKNTEAAHGSLERSVQNSTNPPVQQKKPLFKSYSYRIRSKTVSDIPSALADTATTTNKRESIMNFFKSQNSEAVKSSPNLGQAKNEEPPKTVAEIKDRGANSSEGKVIQGDSLDQTYSSSSALGSKGSNNKLALFQSQVNNMK